MPSRKAKPKRLPARLIGWLIKAVFLFLIVSLLWVLLYRFVPPPITFTMASDLMAGRSLNKDWTPLDRIDRDMVRAVIAAEDSKFCSHRGFDRDAIAAAIRRNAEGSGVIRGGSTISQQTVKNAFLWQGGGYFRKGLEAWFTFLIERMWSKRRIMEVYLNIAETGIGTYGVEAGAQRYFDKGAASLSRSEAARMAAVLPLPKEREAVTPGGFTRRYGNSITARIGVVARDGLDACIGEIASGAAEAPEPKAAGRPKRREVESAAPAPAPEPESADDYLTAPDAGPALEPEANAIGPTTESEPAPGEPIELNGI